MATTYDPITGLPDLKTVDFEVLPHHTDEALSASIARKRELGLPTRADELLLTIPLEYRHRAEAEATREMNMVGGRWSDCIFSAARTINSELAREAI